MTSSVASAYIAVAAEAVAIISRPICRAGFLPKRSPSAPITRSVPPNIRAYASKIHCSSVLSAPRSFESSGRATFRVTLLNMTMIRLRLITPSMAQRFS